MQIREQIILVTGGARGLGLAITQALVAEGARVVVNYFSSEQPALQLQKQQIIRQGQPAHSRRAGMERRCTQSDAIEWVRGMLGQKTK